MTEFEAVLLAWVPAEHAAEAVADLQARADRARGKLGALGNA